MGQHVAVRAMQRYGIHLSRSDQRKIVTHIEHNEDDGHVVSPQRSIHVVTYLNRDMAFMYDRGTHRLLTALPIDGWKHLRDNKSLEVVNI